MARARVFRRSHRLPDGTKKTDRWYSIDFDGPDGTRVLRLALPKTSSRAVADQILQREMAAAWGSGAGGGKRGTTVQDVLDAYDAYLEKASPSTWQDKKSWIRWWGKRFGTRAAASLRTGEIETALLELLETRKEGTVTGYLRTLRTAFRRAVRDRQMASDPTADVALSLGFPERHVLWTEDELARVRAAARPWCSGLLEVLRATGLRIGDALALRWDRLDLENARLRLLDGQEKTGEPLYLPLFARAVRAFQAIPQRPGNPLVFPGQRGGRRAYNRVLRAIHEAMAAADPPVTGKTPHDLRRTWAVELLDAGVSEALIAGFLGQRTTRVVRRYTEVRYSALRATMERLESRPEA